MELNQSAIERAIVAEAVESLMGETDLAAVVKQEIKLRVDKVFADNASDLIEAAVQDVIKSGFEREFVKVDSYGRPAGSPTTIGKELEKLVTGYWAAKVDSAGKPTDSSYNSATRAEWLLVKACGEDFHKLVKDNAIAVTAQLKDGLRGQLRAFVDSSLRDLFRVQSREDQAEGRSRG